MEVVALKGKSYMFLVLTFDHYDLNILSYISPLDANLMFLDSLLKDLLACQMLAEHELI